MNCYIELNLIHYLLILKIVVFTELNCTFYFKQDRDAMLHFDFILLLAMILKRSHYCKKREHPMGLLM